MRSSLAAPRTAGRPARTSNTVAQKSSALTTRTRTSSFPSAGHGSTPTSAAATTRPTSMHPPVSPATTAPAPVFTRLPINADRSVVFEEPAAGHVMLWDATPIRDAVTIDSVTFTKDVSVRMAVSALNSLQTHLRRETSTKNHEIVGFMISPQQAVMATSAARLIEFDCFDKGVRVGAGLEPTTGRGTPVPVYLVQDSESRLLHQLKSDRSLYLFAYNANLQKLSFLHLSPRYKLHLVPIIPPGLVTNSLAAKLQSTATPRTPASGYLAINRARRAYLLRREETSLRLAGLWISGTKDASPDPRRL
ncbi:hypothetical protein AMAG_19330 [Allomyces macrogynus ATCC 38327]|uniref:Uncharacterized protein n=1 Tax=Allomyces macrogynus (strain ATCC 38327) TaxID=578462 RepID=A0A0L0SU26_ALLM3|nr:hypothetical protein AMAG_19330 [Allomyces macrogynus ATCC 38327]|eukprot:KNE66053.1 hypothetical protein AMAG_19330 [Allomyces macrogynus ATCC 38327]